MNFKEYLKLMENEHSETVQHLAQMWHVDPEKVREVKVVPFEGPDKDMNKYFKFTPKNCYQNAQAALMFSEGHDKKWVIGYIIHKDMGVPVEHAWVKIDGEYHDPTEEFALHSKYPNWHYYPFHEFDLDELDKITKHTGDGYLPELHHIARYMRTKRS